MASSATSGLRSRRRWRRRTLAAGTSPPSGSPSAKPRFLSPLLLPLHFSRFRPLHHAFLSLPSSGFVFPGTVSSWYLCWNKVPSSELSVCPRSASLSCRPPSSRCWRRRLRLLLEFLLPSLCSFSSPQFSSLSLWINSCEGAFIYAAYFPFLRRRVCACNPELAWVLRKPGAGGSSQNFWREREREKSAGRGISHWLGFLWRDRQAEHVEVTHGMVSSPSPCLDFFGLFGPCPDVTWSSLYIALNPSLFNSCLSSSLSLSLNLFLLSSLSL